MSEESGRRSSPGFQKQRERAIAHLTRGYVEEALDTQEFEARVDRVYAAVTLQEIVATHSDLVVQQTAPVAATTDLAPRRASQWILALMGGTSRTGRWTPPVRMDIAASMGGVELDFRDADLRPGVTEIRAIAIMGGVEVLVPPGVQVECEGMGIMGAFESYATTPQDVDPSAPILRIGGLALMGGVAVYTRLPGESVKQAKRRLAAERKRLGR